MKVIQGSLEGLQNLSVFQGLNLCLKTSPSADPLGLKLIYESERPYADLIFVHGLGGSSLKTWSHNRNIEKFWPPWLGSEVGLSNTRIFTFGYNASLTQKSPILSILDFAKDLLFQIKMYHDPRSEDNKLLGEIQKEERKDLWLSVNFSQRPMIFVVHSLGGLVVKKAYIIGKTDDQYSDMISQTYGIVFLGTPHRGSNLAHILNNVLRTIPITSTKIYVSELERGSTSLADINEQFRNMCGDLELVSFHETLKTTLGPGVKAMVVEKESAVLGYPSEISAPLLADHHGLAKFPNPDDRNYGDVRNVLRRWVHNIKELQFSGRESPKPTNTPPLATLEHITGIKYTGNELENFRERIYPGTCRWILQKKEFRDWLSGSDSGLSIFWLTGLPATGKTILSSFLIDYLSREDVPGTCHYHFFQVDQHDTRTIAFFLRSLAFQIASKSQIFHSMLIDLHKKTGICFASQKYNLIWNKVFEGLLFRIKLEEPLFWVLDGLDEAETSPALISLITKIDTVTPIKVLLISRLTKDFSAALNVIDCPIYREEMQPSDTADDIKLFVETTVRQALPANREQETVIKNVLSKSSGSFLWVELVLTRLKDNWHTKADIENALTGIPEGMEFMYEKMADVIAEQPSRLRRMATEILTWASCSFRPLDIEELSVALNPEFGAFLDLKTTINQICGNFVIIKISKLSLIHQTAREFLLDKDRHAPVKIDSRLGHKHIAITCMNFMSDNKWRAKLATACQPNHSNSRSLQRDEFFRKEPFMLYAVSYWAYHVSCAPVDSDDLLSIICDFLERFSLIWINAAAVAGKLQLITQSAQYLKAYAKKVARYRNESSPTSFHFRASRDLDLHQWAIDFIRLVGRFGAYLDESPSSIYKHVIPFCPTKSIMSQTFKHTTVSTISILGVSLENWNDCLARLTMGGDETASKIICKDNYFITLIGSSGTLVVWDAETCGEARRLHHGEWVTSIKASKIKSLVASAGIRTIRVWDITTGQEVHRIAKSSQGRLMAFEFTSNDTKLRVAYDDFTIRCIELRTEKEEWCFYAHDDSSEAEYSCPRLMVFSQDGRRIAIAQSGRPVFVWRISRYRQPPQRCIRSEDIWKKDEDAWISPEVVLWQPESSNVLILYHDATLVNWNIDDDTQTQHSHIAAREMAVSNDGNLLLTSDNNGTLSVWSTGQFRLIYQVKYDDFVRDLAWAPDAQRFYDIRGTLCNVWEPDVLIRSDDASREDQSTHDTLYSDPVILPDNNTRVQVTALGCGERAKYYCTGKEDGSVVIFELETAQRLRKLYGHSTSVSVIEIAWSSSLKYIASVDDCGRVIAKRLEKPTPRAPKKWAVYPLFDQRFGSTVTQLLFSHSEEYLLISSGNIFRVWSTKTKQKLFQVEHRDADYTRWMQHPQNPALLICIQGTRQSICSWSTLDVIKQPLDKSDLAIHLEPAETTADTDSVGDDSFIDQQDDLDLNDLKVSRSFSSETLGRVFQSKDRYIILEYIPSRGFVSEGSSQTASRRLEMVDLREGSTSLGLRRRILFELSETVNRLVGIFQGRLVFLDHQYWLCTWDIEGDERACRRHFFLPKDWLSPDALSLVMLDQFGTLLCPRNGDVVIVRSGFKL
ncbi:NACHT and WD domain protein [Penicillium vulpinum]|uniref:NACHT and WD domain protein n=1 Tax=Penicillium vulpinum TaxID=29845 RepID=UPI0025499926|nr:NACHT and WD domain protein [Penicillium vulpinum]KAJ5958775.1 NACHT and WD domain protein [Penicillium vulpinum]